MLLSLLDFSMQLDLGKFQCTHWVQWWTEATCLEISVMCEKGHYLGLPLPGLYLPATTYKWLSFTWPGPKLFCPHLPLPSSGLDNPCLVARCSWNEKAQHMSHQMGDSSSCFSLSMAGIREKNPDQNYPPFPYWDWQGSPWEQVLGRNIPKRQLKNKQPPHCLQ